MKAFDKINLRYLRKDLEAAVAVVAQKNGITITLGNCSFCPTNATFKLLVACHGNDSSAITKEAFDFTQYADLYNMKPTDLGKEFTVGGKTYTLIGIKPSSHKFPLIGRRNDGKLFKFPTQSVKIID